MTESTAQLDAATLKEMRLKDIIGQYPSMAVAYSGGVDSTYLAAVAHDVLGANAHIVIADSPSIPRAELEDATVLARERGWNLVVLKTGEFEKTDYLQNDRRRCYYCKSELFAKMREYAEAKGIVALAYGEIADDKADPTRLGTVAAKERTILAPLQQAELCKEDIRALSAARGLPTWNKASFACLASRFPTGTPIDPKAMAQVEQAEEALKRHGFRQYRARHHGDVCRIELDPADFARLLEPAVRQRIIEDIKAAGYRFVALDLAGYRMGGSVIDR